MNELALFAGAGGGILGGTLLGWRTVAAVEIEEYQRAILLQRQADGILPRFPIWDDVRTFDGNPWLGKVDVITGGFPCQDISAAGKGAGITGERSGLWSEMARIIGEVRPKFCLVENSPMLTSRGLGTVLGDLAEMGYDARWCVLGADDAGAPHRRKRIWILGYSNEIRLQQYTAKSATVGKQHLQKQPQRADTPAGQMADPGSEGLQGGEQQGTLRGEWNRQETHGPVAERRCLWWDIDPADLPDTMSRGLQTQGPEQQTAGITGADIQQRDWPAQSRLGRVAHGVAHRVDRLKAIGNGQVPAVAALAWEILTEGII